MLDIAGLESPDHFAGASFYALGKGEQIGDWRKDLMYEYYWEFNYPSTPTTFALRTDDYKFITYHGLWDTEEYPEEWLRDGTESDLRNFMQRDIRRAARLKRAGKLR